MHADSRRDDLLGAIALVAFFIGMATGNAYVMLGMSITVLMLIAVFRRRKIATGAILVAFTAAVAATAIGIAMAMR